MSVEPFSTIGEQRKYNYALQPMSEEEFVSLVTLDQPAAPDYFLHDAIMNRKEHQILSASLVHALKPLGVREVLDLQKPGAQLLDVRAAIDYEGGHIRESINVGLNGKFASYAGTVLTPDAAIVLIAEPGFEKEAAVRLGRIGFDHVVGFLDGGMASLDDTSGVITQTVRITPVALEERLHQGSAPFLLDVRTGYEHQDGRIKGSKNIPLNDLKMRIQEVPTDEPVAVFCESGYRSAMALGLLEKQGLKDVLHVVGGMAAWRASRLETIS